MSTAEARENRIPPALRKVVVEATRTSDGGFGYTMKRDNSAVVSITQEPHFRFVGHALMKKLQESEFEIKTVDRRDGALTVQVYAR